MEKIIEGIDEPTNCKKLMHTLLTKTNYTKVYIMQQGVKIGRLQKWRKSKNLKHSARGKGPLNETPVKLKKGYS